MTGDQPADLGGVAGCAGVVDSVVRRSRMPVPGARPAVQDRSQLRLGRGQLVLQQLAEQVVVAVPLAPVVERDQ